MLNCISSTTGLMPGYRLRERAKADLGVIWRHTTKH
jgi:plasmid stabilization system protein ParE